MQETIGVRIQRLRAQHDLTVSALARKIGVSPSTLRDWEYGRAIKGEPYLKIASTLNVSVHYLLSGQNVDTLGVTRAVKLLEEAMSILKNNDSSQK